MQQFKVSFYALCSRLLDLRMLCIVSIGILGGVISSYPKLFFFGLFHYLWFLLWRRWVAFFIVLESQQSPTSLIFALKKAARSFFVVLPLSLWYLFLFACNVLIIFKLEHIPESLGLYLIALYLGLEIVQYILDLLFYPLLADGYTQIKDLIYGTVYYVKSYWLSIIATLLMTALMSFLIIYSVAIILFLLAIPLAFFEEFAYFLYFFITTVAFCLFYVRVHYTISPRD